MTDPTTPRFTLCVPLFDEEDNVDPLLDEIEEVLAEVRPFEVCAVDDCSRDGTLDRLKAWKAAHSADWLKIVQVEKNGGQSAAVIAGATVAEGPFIMTMDGDRQNDPRDLVTMLHKLENEGVDGVTGIRKNRKDTFIRRWSSKIANSFRNFVTGDRIADSGCGIKGYKRDLFLAVPRFNGMHRFMATLVRCLGGTVVEIEVNHRPRVAGQAKYGIGNRAWRGVKDCFAIRWMRTRMIPFKVARVD
ncbi:MAG: glycosyltransferase family 2 protein [Planctomycetota bacterium]